jgi:hypothetical protein
MYKLLFISYFPKTINEIYSSSQYFAFELRRLFMQISDCNFMFLNENELNNFDNLPKANVVLLHTYFTGFAHKYIKEIKKHTEAKMICNFMEGYDKNADYNFTYLKYNEALTTFYNAPITKEYLINKPKIKNTILLDHQWVDYKDNTRLEWTKKFHEIFYRYTNYKVFQLRRANEFIPSWITPIESTNYLDYLNKTDNISIFIPTHMGSYNHSIIDMVGRGIKVICPCTFKPFIPVELIKLFNIHIIQQPLEVINEINKPIDNDINSKINLCTDLKDIVNDMNSKFVGWSK